MEVLGDRVDALAVVHREHVFDGHAREHRDLLPGRLGQRFGGPRRHDVRLHARFEQLLEAQLRRLGLLLTERRRLDHVGERDHRGGAGPLLEGQLPQRLDVEGVLVVTHRAADLDEDDVGLRVHRERAEHVLHAAGDVRDHLHVAAEVVARALLVEHLLEDAARGGVVLPREVLVEQALVGAQVHVGFEPVVEHEDLAVAVGRQRAGVEVEVALELDRRDGEPLVLEQLRQRRREDALAQPAHHRAEHHDVAVPPTLVALGHRVVELAVRRGLGRAGVGEALGGLRFEVLRPAGHVRKLTVAADRARERDRAAQSRTGPGRAGPGCHAARNRGAAPAVPRPDQTAPAAWVFRVAWRPGPLRGAWVWVA